MYQLAAIIFVIQKIKKSRIFGNKNCSQCVFISAVCQTLLRWWFADHLHLILHIVGQWFFIMCINQDTRWHAVTDMNYVVDYHWRNGNIRYKNRCVEKKQFFMSVIPILLEFSALTSELQNILFLQTFGAMMNSFLL